VRALAKSGLAAEAIHGNKSQNQRERVLAAFRSGHLRTLVATDIAARGIDVDGISHVVNYDLPNIPESYVHRIGRTARAGADGVAISFCDAEERAYLRDIEKLIRMSIPATDRRSGPHPTLPRERGREREGVAHAGNGTAPARPQPRQHQQKHQQGHQQRRDQQKPRQQQQGRDAKSRNGQPTQKPRQPANQQHRQQGQRPAAQHSAANDGGIATVAFMRPKRNTRRPPSDDRSAPRYGDL
jgi:ATP-dependent RNA helicase RhlE